MSVLVKNCCFFFKQKTAYERRISDWSSDVCSSDLFAGVGERTREGNDLYHEFLDAGVIAKDADGNPTPDGSKVALVFGQMNEPPGARARVALSEIGRAHVRTPVTNAHLVCRLLLEKKNCTKTKENYNRRSIPQTSTHDYPARNQYT